MIIAYDPDHIEVTKFRQRIFTEDLDLPIQYLETDNHNSDNKFSYWYSNQKFLNTGFDKVLLHYHEGEAVGMVGGTHFNRHLYRGVQMYYILKKYRYIKGLNTLHFRENGFFDWQIQRAKELGCLAIFICFDLYDQKHKNMYNAMKNDRVGFGQMGNEERKYTRKDLIYPDQTYTINYTEQKVCYHQFTDIDFHDLIIER